VSHAVRFRPEADAEVVATRDWYEGRQQGLGDAFTTDLTCLIERITRIRFSFDVYAGRLVARSSVGCHTRCNSGFRKSRSLFLGAWAASSQAVAVP
jgi:hypothetical protein